MFYSKTTYILLIILTIGLIFWYFEIYRYKKMLKLNAAILNASIDYYMLNFKEYTPNIKFTEVIDQKKLVYSFKKITPEDYLEKDEYDKLKDFIIW